MLYFETNAVRALSKSLKHYRQTGFTSAFSLIELIAGIEKEFDLRRKVIANIFDTDLKIDWILPEQLVAESFGLDFTELRTGDLKRCCEEIINSSSFPELLSKLNSIDLQFDLNYFKIHKQELNNSFGKATANGNVATKGIAGNRDVVEKLSSYQALNRDITIFALSQLYARNREGIVNHDDAKAFYNSYDGGVERFIEAMSFYSINKMSILSGAKRNDLPDLYHLTYLRNSFEIGMLTDDKMLLALNDQVWPKQQPIIIPIEKMKG